MGPRGWIWGQTFVTWGPPVPKELHDLTSEVPGPYLGPGTVS